MQHDDLMTIKLLLLFGDTKLVFDNIDIIS